MHSCTRCARLDLPEVPSGKLKGDEGGSVCKRASDEGGEEATEETLGSVLFERLADAIDGAFVLSLVGVERVGLEFALDDVGRVGGEPEAVACHGSCEHCVRARQLVTAELVFTEFVLHERFVGEEVHAHSVELSSESWYLPAVHSVEQTGLRGDLLDAVDGAFVEWRSGLRLKADTDVFDGSSNKAVGDTGDASSKVELAIAEGAGATRGIVRVFKVALQCLDDAELDRDTRTDTKQWREGALVKGKRPFVADDARGTVGHTGVRARGRRLKSNLEDVQRLSDQDLCDSTKRAGKHILVPLRK